MPDNENASDEAANGTVAAAQNDQEVANGNAGQQRQQQQQQQQRPDGWSMVKGFIIRLIVIYFISSLFRRGSTPPPQNTSGAGGVSVRGPGAPSTNMFPKGASLDLYIYLSDKEVFSDFNNTEALFWKKTGLVYGDWESGENGDGVFVHSSEIRTPLRMIQNNSMYLHLYFVRNGKSPDPENRLYSKKYTIHRSKMITKMKRRKVSNTVNLLTGVTDGPTIPKDVNASDFLPPVVHWHPNITINLMDDHTQWVEGSIPSPLNEFIEFYPLSGEYYPVVFFNDYWNLNSDYQPVNETTPTLNFSVTYQPISLLRWQLYAGMTMRNKMYGSLFGTDLLQESDDDQDALKKTLIETNPYLLALTIVVSLLHSVFEFLAFKNDIQFWRSRQSLKGLSVRSVFFNVFQSVIVVLYVLDNDTNFVVRVSVVIGLLIEIWKIKKVVNFTVDRSRRFLGVFPRIWFEDKSSYTESETKKYDEMAYRYLSWLLFPMLGVYAVYSLMYVEHKSWYSWVLSMMYGFLLTFGFIMMTPQLFINYKMKSVAHLPWRMLSYKALNTFIDDIFAFVIRMPTLYRIGCLRDDVIFFIFLYQRYIYPIDPKRMNEFGTSQEMLENPELVPRDDQGEIEGVPEATPAAAEEEEDKKTK